MQLNTANLDNHQSNTILTVNLAPNLAPFQLSI
jgi:hypothetical protein